MRRGPTCYGRGLWIYVSMYDTFRVMRVTIDLDAPEGLSDQIRRGIRAAIAGHELVIGQTLPPVRQLAADLGVNFNTVARAYRALEAEGLVRSTRGRGTVVVAREQTPRDPNWRRQWQAQLEQLAADARLAGMSVSEFNAACGDAAAVLWRRSA